MQMNYYIQMKQREQDLTQIILQIDNMKTNICKLTELAECAENSNFKFDDHQIVKQNYDFLKQKIMPMQKQFLKQLADFKEQLEQQKKYDNIQFYTSVESVMSDFYKAYAFFHAQIKYYLERKSILNSEDSDADLKLIQDIIN